MHTDYVFSADVVAEETRQYIHDNDLAKILDGLEISRGWFLKTCVQDVIEKHTQADLRAGVGDENTIRKTVSDRAFELFKNSLNGYTQEQITFGNIIPLVHAIFKGNWGIDVHVVQQLPNLDMWYISNVEFVEKDPNTIE
ncbi:MAG: hypothetical protein IIZ94_11940 [Prevotella sp.]|nr:hypothetical protein [Prevotella sp.]